LREGVHAEHQAWIEDHINGLTDGSQPLQQKERLRMVYDAEAGIHAATQE
jgi:hypothetical protein